MKALLLMIMVLLLAAKISQQCMEKPNLNNFESDTNQQQKISDQKVKDEATFKDAVDEDQSLPIVSLIVTFHGGASYDNLFREVKQVAKDGRVQIYSSGFDKIRTILDSFEKGETGNRMVDQFTKEAKSLDPGAVLFNWECCSECHGMYGYTFENKKDVLDLMAYAIKHQHMMMFSDFAVKALLNIWDASVLGPLPFEKLGECSSQMTLHFNPETLKQSCSKQLQMVGELSANGVTTIGAMGSTIVFGLNKNWTQKASESVYDLEVLTVVTEAGAFNLNTANRDQLSTIQDHSGTIGHAVIKYKTGANLLLSAGHWVELNRLAVSPEQLEKISEKEYGANNMYILELQEIRKSAMSDSEKNEKYEKMASQFVQQTVPNTYSNKK